MNKMSTEKESEGESGLGEQGTEDGSVSPCEERKGGQRPSSSVRDVVSTFPFSSLPVRELTAFPLFIK